MMEIFNILKSTWPGSAELIYSPAGNRQIKNGQEHLYGEPTKSMHFNHVHWAMQAFSDAYRQAIASGGDAGGGFSLDPLNAVRGLLNNITPGPIGDLLKGVAGKMVDNIINFAKDKASSLINPLSWLGGDSSDGGGIAGTGVPSAVSSSGLTGVKAAVQAVANTYGWGSGKQWDALSYIIQHESNWNPLAKNPRSTAFGLFQLLKGNRDRPGGGGNSTDATIQSMAGTAYIAGRYGDAIKAQQFWASHHWYDQGGLASGVGLMQKATIKPERVLNPRQTAAFEEWMRGSHQTQSPLVGSMTFNGSATDTRESLDEAMFRLRRIRRGAFA